MSRTKVPYTFCRLGRKRRYANASLASDALLEAIVERANGNTSRTEQDFYECKKCDGWHLTSEKAFEVQP